MDERTRGVMVTLGGGADEWGRIKVRVCDATAHRPYFGVSNQTTKIKRWIDRHT